MNLKFTSIILFISLVYTSCSNSQGVQLASSDKYTSTQGVSEHTATSILRANELFKAYTDESPKGINLFKLDAATQLKHNPSSELKDSPEAYLLFPSGELSLADTTLILEAYKERLKGSNFLTLDASGNVLYYDIGKRAPRHNYKEATSIVPIDSLKNSLERLRDTLRSGETFIRKIERGVTTVKKTKSVKMTDLMLDTINSEIVYLKDLSEAQILEYAMADYQLNNEVVETPYRGFLWLNFFYKYFDVNGSSESAVGPRWLLNSSVIDAANLEVPDDFAVDVEKLTPLKDVFNKDAGYEAGQVSKNGIRRHYLIVPRKDDFYLEKWKYITLDLSNEFALESKSFNQMVLVVNYLKKEFGPDVIRKLSSWYVDNGKGPLLMTSFLKEEYNVKTNMNDLNQGYLSWVSERSQ